MLDKKLLEDASQILASESKLIELPSYGQGIFVGDTHGDLNASQTVIDRYLKGENTLVFLGDYVDRGEKSRENIDYLLKKKALMPENIILLMGNHDGYKFGSFSPADFWESLQHEERTAYSELLGKLPFLASGNGIIAVHGVPPEVKPIERINSIMPGRDEWHMIVWGDFFDIEGGYMGENPRTGRPEFGKKYFERAMKNLGKNVLIRSHQPRAAGIMYDNRCLTIFTSHAYKPRRTIAVADLGKEVKTVDDINILEI
jgi:predicted phosphodiesterase